VAEGLGKLRKAGIVVLWISQLPAARAAAVAQALRSSGLDPTGTDQLLLVRNPNDRKQLLREDASEDVCVVAIAGDQRGDFDELFDYLRRPWEAFGLDTMLGNGWFLVPSLDAPPAGPP
jgi:predicted secreted acid phosphatase